MKKECFKCHRTLDISEFYRHSKMKDGHLNKCKDCTKRDVSLRYLDAIKDRSLYEKKRAKTEKRKVQVRMYTKKNREKNPEKYKARTSVSNALRSGRLTRPAFCTKCGIKCKPQAHHEDYSKPLDVVWVCAKCHRLITDNN